MSDPAPRQHVADILNGEVIDDGDALRLAAEVHKLRAVVKGLERDVRGWAIRYRQLEEDRDLDARQSPLWPVGRSVFNGWRRLCKHPRSPWTPDRYWAIDPFLSQARYGDTLQVRVELCCRAVYGAYFDPWKTTRRNGTVKLHNDWSLIFRSSDRFEEFANKPPVGWRPVLSDETLRLIAEAEAQLAVVEKARKAASA